MESVWKNSVHLKGGSYYITERPEDIYLVTNGTVLVYIVPWKENRMGRRILFCEAKEKTVIPAFAYEDMERQSWRFCFAALEEADLACGSGMVTKPLKRKFTERAGIKDLVQNGFEDALVNCYRLKQIQEDAYLIKTMREKKETRIRTDRLIEAACLEKDRKPWGEEGRLFVQQEMDGREFARYCLQAVKAADLYLIGMLTVCSCLLGLTVLSLVQKLYDIWIPAADMKRLCRGGCLALAGMGGCMACSVLRDIGIFRVAGRIQNRVQNFVCGRIFTLPEHFFQNYGSTDLVKRMAELGYLSYEAANLALSLAVRTAAFLFFAGQMFCYSKKLAVAALVLMVLFSAAVCAADWYRIKYRREIAVLDTEREFILYQFLQGIGKLRATGTEGRAVYEYMKPYVRQRQKENDFVRLSNLGKLISLCGGYAIIAAVCILAYGQGNFMPGQFASFCIAAGIAYRQLGEITKGAANGHLLRPVYERVRILFETAAEESGNGQEPEEVMGKIDIEHVGFSYEAGEEPVFEDLDLHIRAGEYIGLVGASGCGKSTLLKLLLGFEKPAFGRICYDNQDIANSDPGKLRKKFGVVLQDGKLISGNIYDNITLTYPDADSREVRAVLHAIGLAEDIARMPMGLQTMVSEKCDTISTGQKQKILIARALIANPRVLFLDEASSALDNRAQSAVCSALEQMDGTRLVIAHRPETVRNCSRILVLDQGRIAEEGTYDSLMRKKGLFYELAGGQKAEGTTRRQTG